MKILSVEKYKGNTYCIILDSGEHIYVNESIVSEYGLKGGIETDASTLNKAKDSDLRRKAKERALYLLSYRDHSYVELFDKLIKNYPEDIAYDICDKMVSLGFINDEKYALRLANQMWNNKYFGLRKIRYELKHKGFSEEVIDSATLEIAELDAKEKIFEIVDKKYARYLTDERGVKKVTNALARLGHNFSDIKEVIKEYLEE